MTADLQARLAEHRRNDVDDPGGGREPVRWRVKCDGPTCDFYAEAETWFLVCEAHESHLAEVLDALVSAHVARVREGLADEIEALAATSPARASGLVWLYAKDAIRIVRPSVGPREQGGGP